MSNSGPMFLPQNVAAKCVCLKSAPLFFLEMIGKMPPRTDADTDADPHGPPPTRALTRTHADPRAALVHALTRTLTRTHDQRGRRPAPGTERTGPYISPAPTRALTRTHADPREAPVPALTRTLKRTHADPRKPTRARTQSQHRRGH